jgi:hypothetical protein
MQALAPTLRRAHDRSVEPEPLLYREEVTAMLMTLADINVNIRKILDLLENSYGEEEELENDS